MAKQILLYSSIYSDTAAKFLNELNDNAGKEICVSVNCPGGDPYSTYGMIAVAGKVDAKYDVHGQASSCAFFLVANAGADNVECLDVSTFVAHRAATYLEKYPEYFTDDVKAELQTVNDGLRSIIEKNLPEFEAVTGVSLDDLFSLEKRIDVRINAKQAKKMGLVGKVNKLTTTKKAEVVALSNKFGIAAFAENAIEAETEITNNDKSKKMDIKTLAELQAQYPNLCAELIAATKTDAIKAEQKRVKTWMKYNKVDPVAVAAGIEAGTEVDMEVMADMQVKMASPEYLEALKKGNANIPDTNTGADAEAKTEADKFLAEADKEMGWDKKA